MISPAAGTKYADVPFKPAGYPIVGAGKTKPGQFTVMGHVGNGATRRSLRLTQPGTLTLTQFDGKGIAGTFAFQADTLRKPTQHVAVTGSFAYACHGGACK